MDTLEVLNFDARKVMAHDRVIEWQAEMETKRKEEEAFLRDMDNEEAMMSYHGL
ncbi:hypothetical protein BD410DRAFT_781411 [Rickenella mellea]|uniref:Uncharacterized protein n=1 Tax=Rickenella mellea TaxID=50990 RepID=A0A4Y7QN55_9AGAM|nr:hypothetical protein BD410DRAFT_781411 [Rickenella mellea]